MPTVQELFSLEGQTALITGGTRGIGQAMAIALAEVGADIILVQRNTDSTTTRDAILALGRRCTILVADLSSPDSMNQLLDQLFSNPDRRIHILLNSAGIQSRHPATDFPDEDWHRVMQVNLHSVFTLCRAVGKHMLEQLPISPGSGRKGTIINLASLLSFSGGVTVPAYAASKGGIAQLTKALSNEWAGKGVTVNAIAPGYIATEMNTALMEDENRSRSIMERIPMGRWGEPEDFKGVVVWLASRASAYVTGEVVTVDGGWMGR